MHCHLLLLGDPPASTGHQVCPSAFQACGSGQSQTWRGTGTIVPGSSSVCGPLVMICNMYQSLPDLLPTILGQTCRPQKHPGRSKQKDWIRQPELGCKTQMLVSVHHHI